jgi:hypothetical protein
MIPAMSDRGLPIVDGAPACPFVAFEDDRDGRSTAPDHRHRCFAEPRPAPRALAHQEAYCLASAFPVCPTFQDWARREAAAARPGATARPPDEVLSQASPHERDDYYAGPDEPTPAPPRRQQRDWAAPPPWAAAAGAAAAGATGAAAGGAAAGAGGTAAGAGATPIEHTPPEARGLAGSAADRLAGPDPADPLSSAPSRADEADNRYAPPVRPPDDLDDEVRDDAPAAAAAAGIWAASSIADLDDDEPDWASLQADVPPAEPRAAASAPRPPVHDDARPPAPNPRDQVSRRKAQDPDELFGPAWERPHRYEAYPSLRTRVGLPGLGGVGRVGIGALALFVAALALFFVGPRLLGIGDDDSGGGAGATSTPIAEETASPDPTPVPEPTPTIYVVKKGDTMSKIANKFDLTVDQLLAANPQIKNPNKISIGDEVTIPVPDSEEEAS